MTPLKTIAPPTLSNLFMTFAWHAHLKEMKEKRSLHSLCPALCMAGAVFFMFRDGISPAPPAAPATDSPAAK